MPRKAGLVITCRFCRYPSAILVPTGKHGNSNAEVTLLYRCPACNMYFNVRRWNTPKLPIRGVDGIARRFAPSTLMDTFVSAVRKTNRLHPKFAEVSQKEEIGWAQWASTCVADGALQRIFRSILKGQVGLSELESDILTAAAFNAFVESARGEWEKPYLTACLKLALHRHMFSEDSPSAGVLEVLDLLLDHLRGDKPLAPSSVEVPIGELPAFFSCPACGGRAKVTASRRTNDELSWLRELRCDQCEIPFTVRDSHDWMPLGITVTVNDSEVPLDFNLPRLQTAISLAVQDIKQFRSSKDVWMLADRKVWDSIFEASRASEDWTTSPEILSWAVTSVLAEWSKLAAVRYICHSGRFHEPGMYDVRELLELVDREVYVPYYAQYAEQGLVPASMFGEWP